LRVILRAKGDSFLTPQALALGIYQTKAVALFHEARLPQSLIRG